MKLAPTLLHTMTAGACLLILAGCVAVTPELDRHFGDSVRIANAQQTIAPEASTNTKLVGMDGPSAHASIVDYRKSYAAPPPQMNVFTIGVGNGGSR